MSQTASTNGKRTAGDVTALLGVRITKDLHVAARRRAFDEGRTLANVVRDALEQYLAKPHKPSKKKASA